MKTLRTLSQAIAGYLDTRRAFGFALKSEAALFASLARYARHVGHRGPLTEALAVAWARLPALAHPVWWARRLQAVRRLARFWQAFNPHVQVPPPGLFGPSEQRRPVHIYTATEITRLLAATATLAPGTGLRPHTFKTLLGLLACTGLRIAEALHLQTHEFDPVMGTLQIHHAKGGQARCVPLHPSAVAALQAYLRQRHHEFPQAGPGAFFLSQQGKPLTYKQAAYAFHQLRQGLPGTQTPRPRLHDLRHTFAVQRLVTWQRRGDEAVHQKTLALATYLGHRNIRHTYWYLSAVPELLASATRHLVPAPAQEDCP